MTAFERWAVWSSSVLTFVTGVVYLWLKYVLVSDDPFAAVNHPWQPVVLKLHILVAPLLVFSVGMVTLRHVWRHLRAGSREGRRSGLVTLVVLGPMIVTGYLIQAITAERLLWWIAWAHIGIGLLYGGALLVHQFAAGGREARAARARQRRAKRRHRHASRRPAHRQNAPTTRADPA